MSISRRNLLNWILPSTILTLMTGKKAKAESASSHPNVVPTDTLSHLPSKTVGESPNALYKQLGSEIGADLIGYKNTTVAKKLDALNDYFPDTPEDYLIGSFFSSNSDNTLNIFHSFNGHDFIRSNQSLLVSGDANIIGNRDPSITYFKGNWYVAATTGGNNVKGSGKADFLIFKSADLISWRSYKCFAGPKLLKGQKGSVINGTIDKIAPIWAPSLFIKNDELWVQLSIGFKPKSRDINGVMVNWCAPFACKCNDIDALTFESPQQLMDDTSVQRIDVEVTESSAGNYIIAIKNEFNKHIEIWESSKYIGGYSKIADLDFGGTPVEGPCLVWINSQKKWRLYADAFKANGTVYYTESPDLRTWTTPMIVQSTWPLRHGTVLNLSNLPESRKAINSFVIANNIMSSPIAQPYWDTRKTLHAGRQTLIPQCNFVYCVSGKDSSHITINKQGGDWFYLLVSSQMPLCGIIVDGSAIDGNFTIGFGQTNQRLYKVYYNKKSKLYQLEGTPNNQSIEIPFHGQPGWPIIDENFTPIYGATYSTSSKDKSDTTISDINSTLPDGSLFHLWIESNNDNGAIIIKSGSKNIKTGNEDIVLSGSKGHGYKIYTIKKISGSWRLVAS